MQNAVKLTQDEINDFNKIKNNIQKNIFDFGELYLEKMELDAFYKKLGEKELELRKLVELYKNQQSTFLDNLAKKYGEGNLNFKTWEFIPNK